MKSKKEITIKTMYFDLVIHWNGLYVSAQLSILAGLLLLFVFSRSKRIDILCIVLLMLNLIVLIVLGIKGSNVTTSENSVPAKTVDIPAPPQVTQAASAATDNNQKPVSIAKNSSTQSSGSINNKVPTPVPSYVTPQSIPTPEPPVEETVNDFGMSSFGIGGGEELTEDDWNELFNL